MAYKRSRILLDDDLGTSSGQLAPNAGNLTSNKLVKASSGGLTNSNITDNGTTVSVEKPLTVTDGVSVTSTAATAGKFTGDLLGNASTATTLETSRTFKVGSSEAKPFNGGQNIEFSHNEMKVSRGGFVSYSYGGFGSATGATAAWGWIRIASIGSYGYGTFSISNAYSWTPPSAVKFFVSSQYGSNNGMSIVQLGGKSLRFSKARIVIPPSGYGTGYVEVYYSHALNSGSNTLYVSLSDSYLTTLLPSKTQGEIPEGWTSYELAFTNNGLSAKSGLFNNLVIDKGANNETASLTIGSSSAPATLNVYGKSTLRDRLTVPKDGSNSTSGIIDAGDSYYLGGNRWIHNQGGNTCTAVGYDALRDNTEGSYNCAMGSAALRDNTTGRDNLAVGYAALRANTEGSYNSAIGYTLVNNTLGDNNSAMGYGALYGNRTGSNNSAMGCGALRGNTKGSNNSAMGYAAGRYIANGSTGKTTGDNNLYLGSETKAKEDGTNNEIVIGAYAIGLGSNSMVLGHTTNLLTALRGKVGIGTDAPEHGLHVGTNYNSDGNIKADAKLIAGTDVEAGNNVTAVETVQGKNIAAVASNSTGGDITADNNIYAGYDITAQNNVTGFVVNAIKDINAGNNITATETVTGKNLVATQSITAGTTIDAGGNITSDDTVQGNYVNAVKKNNYGGDVNAENNVNAVNDVIASRVVSAGHALNTTMTDPLNQGEVLIHDDDNYPNNLGSDVMLSGISTDDKYIADTRRYIEFDIKLPMFQVETLLAYKIITIDNQIIREEGISIVSTISTLLDWNGIRMQRHKVLSHHCIGYRPSVSYVDIWDNALAMGDANNPGVNDAILQGDFFSFDETLLENNKLSPVVKFTDLSAFVDNYNLGTTFKIDYSYRFNVNAFGSDEAISYASK